MESENSLADKLIKEYGKELNVLFAYIPYFSSRETAFSKKYDGEQGDSVMGFPVFDSTLLDFIKKVSGMKLINRNYPYVYARRRFKSHEDERRFIENSTISDVDDLRGVLSKYVIEGRHRGPAWAEGATEGIYLGVLTKFKDLIDFYRKRRNG